MSRVNEAVPHEKVTCTGDAWCGCICHACTVSFEHCDQVSLIVDGLLTEADQHMAVSSIPASVIGAQIASSIANASAARPIDCGRMYCEALDNKVLVTIYTRNQDNAEVVREFVAELREVR